MHILVTGCLGFIGQHVVTRLVDRGHRVLGVDALEPRVHGNKPLPDMPDVAYTVCAQAPYSYLAQADAIVHLAAQVGVADSMTDPLRYVRDNTCDTAEFLLKCEQPLANRGRLRRLVVASSMSIYGDPQTREGVTERHPPAPASVYGLTKYDQERLCLLWGGLHGIETTALRLFNIYGPGQALTNPYTGVLANFAQRILHGQSPIVYEDGQQTRDFTYVDDIADAIVGVVLTERPLLDVYNVCVGHATTLREAALILAAAMDRPDLAPELPGTIRPGDIRHCVGDSTRLRTLLPDWQPRSFVDGALRYAETLRV